MPKKILIVEDNKDMQEVYRNYFKGKGQDYEVEMEGDAQAALEKARKERYDLIITDIIMEPMNGESFLDYVKGDSKTKDVPVLVVSVLSPEMLIQLKKYERVGFMQKPVPKERFMGMLSSMLGH